MSEEIALRWLRRAGLLAFAGFVCFPVVVLVLMSVKPLVDVDDVFRWVPSRVTLSPYAGMWESVPFGRYLLNSVLVASLVAGLAVGIGLPVAYVLARTRMRGRRTAGIWLLATQAAPGLLFLLPLFLVYRAVDDAAGVTLIGTRTGLILTDLTFALPFTVWLLIAHLESLPTDHEEAARMDGAGTIAVLRHVVLPLAGPGIAVVGIFAFMVAWGEVLFASVLTHGPTRTVAVGLHDYAGQGTVWWNQLAAAALVSSLPVVVAALVAWWLLGRRSD